MNRNFNGIFIEQKNFCGRGQAVVKFNSCAEFVEFFFSDDARNFCAISFFDFVARVNQCVCKFAVVRQKQKPFGIQIESADGINALRKIFAQKFQNGFAAAIVVHGRNVTARLVEQQINFFRVEVQKFSVDADFIFRWVSFRAEFRDNFAVKQHLKYVELYANPDNYNALAYEDTLLMGQELAPLIEPDADDAKALRFDALLYGIELAYLAGKKYSRARHDLLKKVSAVASVANIPEIMMQAELIDRILHTDYLDTAGINEFEHVRENLRDLIKYIPQVKIRYDTDFDDEILSMEWKESELENDDLKNYKAKAEFYIRQHQDNAVIAKLKGNIPLTEADVKVLEGILWSEVGTKQEYEAEYGVKPLGEFVREIVGLDMNAAKAAFAEFLNDANLDSRQIYFVNQIVEYIVHNGMMKDLSVLQETPFTDQGSIVEVFTDLTIWMGIRRAIEQVNANAVAT